MIITPPIFTPVHQEEVEYLNPTAEETILKFIRNTNFLLDLAPIGTVIYVNTNQLGGGQPNSSLWQVCDGSEITNPNSPIRSIGLNLRYTPNHKDQYSRVANNPNLNATGGTQNHLLQHSHSTSGANTDGGGLADKGDRNRRNPHSHTLATQYEEAGTIIDAPAYVYFIAYMKIC